MQVIAQDDCKNLPKPLSGKLVNDFYQKIGDNSEQELETLLRNYNDSTSIEIAIVTMENIGYESGTGYATKIGNCWGVGKKAYDNGIVILVSFEGDRAWAIVSGKGMDQYLTDFRASSIGQENLIPNLQKGKVDEALISTANAIINYLGWKSWEMREYWSKWDKESSKIEKSYNKKETARGFGVFFTWVFYIALLAYIIWCVLNWNEDIKIRRKIKSSIRSWDKEITENQKFVVNEIWPKWALDALDILRKREKEFKSAYATNKLAVLKVMRGNPQKAHDSLLPVLYENYKWIVVKIPGLVLELQKEKSLYEEEALSKVQTALKLIGNVQSDINKFVQGGFLFEDYTKQIAPNKDILLNWEKELSKNPKSESFKEAYDASMNINKSVEEISKNAKLYVSRHGQISSSEEFLNKTIKDLGNSEKKVYGDILKNMQKVYPENVWKDLQKQFITVDNLLKEASTDFQMALEQNNIHSINSITQAYKSYTEGASLIASVKSIYKSIDEGVIAQVSAKRKYKELNSSAKKALEEAAKECEQEHVKSEAKSLKDKATGEMKKAEVMLSSGVVDWVWLVALLVSIKEIAENSHSQASRDISNYTSYHSSSSYSSSSSSSHSSFGGFGGGSFGGGGAGGRW